jgi:hypothetical protein
MKQIAFSIGLILILVLGYSQNNLTDTAVEFLEEEQLVSFEVESAMEERIRSNSTQFLFTTPLYDVDFFASFTEPLESDTYLTWDLSSTANTPDFRAEQYSIWMSVLGTDLYNDVTMLFEEKLSTDVPNPDNLRINPNEIFDELCTVTLVARNFSNIGVEGVKISIYSDTGKYCEVFTNQNGIATVELPNGLYFWASFNESYQHYAGEFFVYNQDITVYVLPHGDEDDTVNAPITFKNVNVYPNPFASFIKLTNACDVRSVSIANVFGRVVGFIQNNGNSEITYHTNHLPNGLFFLTIELISGEKVVQKILKE